LKIEDRCQRTEDRRQKTKRVRELRSSGVRELKIEDRGQKTDDR